MSDAIRVVSLFCGLGGADLGLYWAADELGVEVEVVDAIDSWEPAVRVYNANQRHPVARVADVKKLTRADLPEHDLVIGGPPCQDHSLAGKRKCKCNVGGYVAARCCLADFVRLTEGSAWIMENVVPRLINAPWSERLCAADFGDVTKRKRWFYSNYLLHIIPTPGPRRIRDIRDHAEDARVLEKRRGCKAGNHGHYDSLDSLTAHSWHGHDVRGHAKFLAINDGFFNTLKASDYHAGPKIGKDGKPRGHTKLALTDDEHFGSFTSSPHGGISGQDTNLLRLGLRGNSASASASAFNDDEVLGSLLANAFHANEASKLEGCRNPSLVEMRRAHSLCRRSPDVDPDEWDWAGVTKSQMGQLIANSWPAYMAKAVIKAMLQAIIAEREMAA